MAAQMAEFTVRDVCNAFGVEKHAVRAWLRLSPFRDREVNARSARKFDARDLLFFALIATLHSDLGIPPRAIGRASGALYELLLSQVDQEGTISINFERGKARYVSDLPKKETSVLLSVERAVGRVQAFLLGSLSNYSSERRVLPFKPTAIRR